ncbi:protein of unknown function, DUF488 [Lentimicrobium saccharophilum]|jgi:uncharacterized protein (DUF488 family)|uniref:Protein containing DUF488 n=1 Tax=Lentimicrobium saccharophilum TaxID=1678841 RepID=A0A0S7C3B3_9BACT|nr:DUF488 domain-containing protein [Lentimicrobium saccharophilum]GAP43395.1 protein of unknown function, DUF488 [Lentimicrobium saccharophilum]
MEFFTIGVYNSTEKEFFDKLTKNNIDTFCDIRQRRGVRGAKYSFVNSNRLQQKLNELEIKYGYVPELAPTSEIRGLQKEIDIEKGELKRERHELGKVFVIEYKNKILKNFDFETFIEKLEQVGANRVAFFCVEEFPEACHRSIVTDRLTDKYNYKVTHL